MPSDGRPLTLHVPVPGGHDLSLEHLVLDVNGILSDRGKPIVTASDTSARMCGTSLSCTCPFR
jgi:hypothetical protein